MGMLFGTLGVVTAIVILTGLVGGRIFGNSGSSKANATHGSSTAGGVNQSNESGVAALRETPDVLAHGALK